MQRLRGALPSYCSVIHQLPSEPQLFSRKMGIKTVPTLSVLGGPNETMHVNCSINDHLIIILLRISPGLSSHFLIISPVSLTLIPILM